MTEYICTMIPTEYGGYLEPVKPLVRCKNCMKNMLCIMFRSSKNPEGYCCWAEKREE